MSPLTWKTALVGTGSRTLSSSWETRSCLGLQHFMGDFRGSYSPKAALRTGRCDRDREQDMTGLKAAGSGEAGTVQNRDG